MRLAGLERNFQRGIPPCQVGRAMGVLGAFGTFARTQVQDAFGVWSAFSKHECGADSVTVGDFSRKRACALDLGRLIKGAWNETA